MECNPPTAKPGESQHELGRAVDFGGDLSIVAELAPKHELVATVAGEPWHYEHRTTARGVAERGEQPISSSSPGGGGSLVGSALGNVPFVGGALSAAWGWKDALGALAGAITNPRFWLRVLAAIVGGAFVLMGFAMIGFDATSRDAEQVDMTYSAVV